MTDLSLPGIGGHELAARLIQEQPKLKVLFTSGYSLDGETERVLTETNGAFLQKPFVLDDLASTVRELLAQ
jgi:CheY-like chemotaxis protein